MWAQCPLAESPTTWSLHQPGVRLTPALKVSLHIHWTDSSLVYGWPLHWRYPYTYTGLIPAWCVCDPCTEGIPTHTLDWFQPGVQLTPALKVSLHIHWTDSSLVCNWPLHWRYPYTYTGLIPAWCAANPCTGGIPTHTLDWFQPGVLLTPALKVSLHIHWTDSSLVCVWPLYWRYPYTYTGLIPAWCVCDPCTEGIPTHTLDWFQPSVVWPLHWRYPYTYTGLIPAWCGVTSALKVSLHIHWTDSSLVCVTPALKVSLHIHWTDSSLVCVWPLHWRYPYTYTGLIPAWCVADPCTEGIPTHTLDWFQPGVCDSCTEGIPTHTLDWFQPGVVWPLHWRYPYTYTGLIPAWCVWPLHWRYPYTYTGLIPAWCVCDPCTEGIPTHTLDWFQPGVCDPCTEGIPTHTLDWFQPGVQLTPALKVSLHIHWIDSSLACSWPLHWRYPYTHTGLIPAWCAADPCTEGIPTHTLDWFQPGVCDPCTEGIPTHTLDWFQPGVCDPCTEGIPTHTLDWFQPGVRLTPALKVSLHIHWTDSSLVCVTPALKVSLHIHWTDSSLVCVWPLHWRYPYTYTGLIPAWCVWPLHWRYPYTYTGLIPAWCAADPCTEGIPTHTLDWFQPGVQLTPALKVSLHTHWTDSSLVCVTPALKVSLHIHWTDSSLVCVWPLHWRYPYTYTGLIPAWCAADPCTEGIPTHTLDWFQPGVCDPCTEGIPTHTLDWFQPGVPTQWR